MIMGGNHFMDDNKNPSVDNNKGPRLVAMELILWMMMELSLLRTIKLILWIVTEIPVEQKVNKVLKGQSNQCGCREEPVKEKQYRYKHEYKFKY